MLNSAVREMRVSPVYYANMAALLDPSVKIIVNQGGSRSGKTYSITQLLMMVSYMANKRTEISMVSQTMPHIKRGVLKDFKNIMYDLDIWDKDRWHATDHIYTFGEQIYMEFFSVDDGSKVRGASRDYLFINEANAEKITYDIWKQLLMRTRKKIFIDYNPSDEFHWIYDFVLPREDCRYIHSTFLDNYDFLPLEQVKEIERLKEEDNNYWKIYGLGERAKAINLIYPNFVTKDVQFGGDKIYGLDFGFNNQTALVEVMKDGRDLSVKQLVYEKHLTNSDLIELLKTFNIGYGYIYADGAEPQRIEEIARAGFNIHRADKSPNSVKTGIDFIQRFKIYAATDSPDLQKELKCYKWKEDRNGKILDEPLKFMDHLMDAMRYAVHTHGSKYWTDSAIVFPSSSKNSGREDNSFRSRLSKINGNLNNKELIECLSIITNAAA